MKTLLLLFAIAAELAGQSSSRNQTFQPRGGRIRSVQDKLADTLSAKDFGALGDGVADDTVALQRALDAACGGSFVITGASNTTPIIVTITPPHYIANGSTVTIAAVGGNTAANGTFQALRVSPNTAALYDAAGAPIAGNGTYTAGGTISAPATPRLYLPAGTYNTSANLVPRCGMFIAGDGPGVSIIFLTEQHSGAPFLRAINTDFSLWIQDLSVNTTPLVNKDWGITGVARGYNPDASSTGQSFMFLRFGSTGFNFGMVISGKGKTDIADSITVRDSVIVTYTAANAVSNPVNVANSKQLTVENSTLTGDGKGDHAIYSISIRGVQISGNLLSGYDNSAIKLLTDGFGGESTCPLVSDYTGWTIANNTIQNTRLALAAYTYCNLVLPSLDLTHNQILDTPNPYAGDFAAVYIQASCQSNILHVNSAGNTFRNIGLGGIILLSSVEFPTGPCADAAAEGTIANFHSTGDTFVNFSVNFAGTFPAINETVSTTGNLKRASISQLRVDGQANGNSALSLGDFAHVVVMDVVEVNTTAPASASPHVVLKQVDPAIPIMRWKLAASPSGSIFTISDSAGNELANMGPGTNLNFPSTPGVYAINGVRLNDAHIVTGRATLAAGANTITLTGKAVFTSSTSYECAVGERSYSSPSNPYNIDTTAGNTITITVLAAATIGYVCVGN